MRFSSVCFCFLVFLSSSFLADTASAGGKRLACYEQAVIPATFKIMKEQVLVQPERRRLVKKPAVYGYQSFRKMVQPASIGWEYRYERGRKILCKVKHPPVYAFVKKKVMLEPAMTYVVREPAIYKYVKRRVKVSNEQLVWRPVAYRSGCR